MIGWKAVVGQSGNMRQIGFNYVRPERKGKLVHQPDVTVIRSVPLLELALYCKLRQQRRSVY